MKKLLIYLRKYIKESVLGPLFKLLEASFELIVPIVIADIVDIGIVNGDKSYIVTRAVILVVLGIVGLSASILAQYFAAKAAAGFATELRHSLFSHIQSLSFREIDKLGTSKLITRMTSDVNTVQSCVNMFLRLFLRSPFIVFGAMIMAFTIDVKCALIFVGLIVLLLIIVFAITLTTIPMYSKVQTGLDRILKITRENLSGTRVIRAFNKEQEEIEDFKEKNSGLYRLQTVAGRISALMNPLTFIVVNTAMVILIYTGAVRVDAGILKQGQVIALVNYMSQVLVELIKLANLIIQITKAFASADRIQNIFETESSMEYGNTVLPEIASEYAVEFENAELRYSEGGEPVLSDISFKVKKGETVGIIGGTGSGKTSLVNMISRFYDATAGEVKVNGINVKEYTKDAIRSKVGIVMQKAVLFSGTVRDNIKWGNIDADDNEVMEALRIAQADSFMEEKEGGLDYMSAQGGRNFSGGQRQRLSIARAVIKKPEILIFDDSSSALDYLTDSKLRKAIKELKGPQGAITTFIVSQRTSSIREADKIIVLEDGQIAGIGTHEQLLESCDIYNEIHNTDGNRTRSAGGAN